MNNEIKEINLTNEEYIKHLENAIKDLNEYNDNLQQENKDLKLQLRGTTHCYDEMEHSTLKNEVFYLQIENNLMKKQLSNINQHIDDAENKFKELMEILERFNNDNN